MNRIIFLFVALPVSILSASLSNQDLDWIGNRIWFNECSEKVENLTFWNKNEPFPSFGIGHFIWFPEGYIGPYTQTFPDLIAYLKKSVLVPMPSWLLYASDCPWATRDDFYRDFNNEKMSSLRFFLQKTIKEQAAFIIEHFRKNIECIIKDQKKQHDHLSRVIQILQCSAHGWYVLIDYHNFKGAGTNVAENYSGHRWGLLQVLENIPPCTTERAIIDAFINEAKKLLEIRVACAPEGKKEKQFLEGWFKRLESYRFS